MKLVWTEFAIENLKIIFDYHASKAGKKVAHTIRKQIFTSTKQLMQHPESGQIELHLEKLSQQYRYILSGHYKIIYTLDHEYVIISDIFDVRQNPVNLMNNQRNKK